MNCNRDLWDEPGRTNTYTCIRWTVVLMALHEGKERCYVALRHWLHVVYPMIDIKLVCCCQLDYTLTDDEKKCIIIQPCQLASRL